VVEHARGDAALACAAERLEHRGVLPVVDREGGARGEQRAVAREELALPARRDRALAAQAAAELLEVAGERRSPQRRHEIARDVQREELPERHRKRDARLPAVDELPAGAVGARHGEAGMLERVEIAVDGPRPPAAPARERLDGQAVPRPCQIHDERVEPGDLVAAWHRAQRIAHPASADPATRLYQNRTDVVASAMRLRALRTIVPRATAAITRRRARSGATAKGGAPGRAESRAEVAARRRS
jgi:hypothetical protein